MQPFHARQHDPGSVARGLRPGERRHGQGVRGRRHHREPRRAARPRPSTASSRSSISRAPTSRIWPTRCCSSRQCREPWPRRARRRAAPADLRGRGPSLHDDRSAAHPRRHRGRGRGCHQQVTARGDAEDLRRGPREGCLDRHGVGANGGASVRRWPRRTCRSSAKLRSRSSPARSPSLCRASSAGT